MKSFAPYASRFEAFVDSNLDDIDIAESVQEQFDCLDPYEALRTLVPVGELRALGVFFTGQELVDHLWKPALGSLSVDSIIVDPACGAGDLLVVPAGYLAGLDRNGRTISLQIRGTDLEESFLRTARARLKFQHSRGGNHENFEQLRIRDFLADPSGVAEATHVVMNPPFFQTQAPDSCDWAAGKVNSAAIFVMTAIQNMKEGSRLLAILPEVLRSGARYEKWRARVAAAGNFLRIEPLGQFDAETDVHVFIMDFIVTGSESNEAANERPWSSSEDIPCSRVSDYFEVRVGPVVPHRDPLRGQDVPFLTTKSIVGNQPVESRQFAGRLDAGPMVLVSRTSRPGQVPRARATLWRDEEASAVENHLLVLKPLDGSVETCQQLVSVLHNQKTTLFLDKRIRCRHLTVGAIREIPWIEQESQ